MEREGFHFCDFQFFPHECLLVRLADRHQFHLTPQQSRFLGLLIRKSGELVTYAEIRQSLWPAAGPRVKLGGAIREIKSSLCKHLGKSDSIETITRKGYRFCAIVTKLHPVENVDVLPSATEVDHQDRLDLTVPEEKPIPNSLPMPPVSWQPQGLFGGHAAHVLTASALYALLYAEAVFLEVSYQYDRFGLTAWKAAPFVFGWIFMTSLAAFKSASHKSIGGAVGLARSALIMIFAALVLFLALGSILPNTQITKASFQTYTAHAAFLKNIVYFLPLAIVFLLIPFHFIVSLNGDANSSRLLQYKSIYLRVWHLVLLLGTAALFSSWAMSHLLDNLTPAPHTDLFIELVEWRRILYFSLGVECIIWYSLQRGSRPPAKTLLAPVRAA